MSSDNFLVYFGVRFTLPADADVEALELGVDPRLRAAKRARLKTWWGRLTDGEYYFILIGEQIGRFGVDAASAQSVGIAELVATADDVRVRLREAGFEEEPAVHFQLEAEY